MKDLIISSDRNTPKVTWSLTDMKFEISGKSFPENTRKFFEPLFDWIEDLKAYADNLSGKSLTFRFELEYINSSSIMAIMKIINELNDIHNKCDVSIKWYYEDGDDDIMSIGMDYKELSVLPFEIISF